MPHAPRPRFGVLAALLALLALLGPVVALADDMAPAGVKGEMLMWIKDAESKLGELATAMPEGKYAWRPDKGVRSQGEVFLHVAAANFGIPGFMGIQPPAGFKFDGYEQSLTKKDDIVKALKDSFAHMENALSSMSDADMDKPAELFGMKLTNRSAFLLLLSHAHEHLGQSIAYSRVNKITPPWTAREQAAAAKEKEKKGGM